MHVSNLHINDNIIHMNQQWVYNTNWYFKKLINGLREFLNAVDYHKLASGFISCPCKEYKNEKEYCSSRTQHIHLLQIGFVPHYIWWTKYGERRVIQKDNEEEDGDDNILNFAQYDSFVDTTIG